MAQRWSGLTGWKRAAVATLPAFALVVQGLSGASPTLQAATAPAPVVGASLPAMLVIDTAFTRRKA